VFISACPMLSQCSLPARMLVATHQFIPIPVFFSLFFTHAGRGCPFCTLKENFRTIFMAVPRRQLQSHLRVNAPPIGDSAKFAHDSLGGAICLTQSFSRWPAMPMLCGSTRARDSSEDSAHLDTATATQLHVDVVAELASLLPAPCYCDLQQRH